MCTDRPLKAGPRLALLRLSDKRRGFSTMASWTLETIVWDRFDGSKVDPEILRNIKAAALVERNAVDYGIYLGRVFADDPSFMEAVNGWVVEEIQHGMALGRWAQLADPDWDFDAAFARFRAGYKLPLEATASVRGSQAGEMMARCIVETGTSSYYSALKDALAEPVLKQICGKIAADEFRHYKLFYEHLRRCLKRDRLSRWGRLRIGWGRLAESEDDELAYAYFAANEPVDAVYDRERSKRAYAQRVYPLYRQSHVRRAMAMVLKAVGLQPQGRLNDLLTRAGLWFLRRSTIKYAGHGV
jgi:rubrerythrin